VVKKKFMLVKILKKMVSKMTSYFPFIFLQRNTYLGSEKGSLPLTTFMLIQKRKKKKKPNQQILEFT